MHGICKCSLTNEDYLIFLNTQGAIGFLGYGDPSGDDWDKYVIKGIRERGNLSNPEKILPINNLQLLNNLCEEFNVKVILSPYPSATASLDKVIDLIKTYGGTFDIIGSIPNIGNVCSGMAIKKYMMTWMGFSVYEHRKYAILGVNDDNLLISQMHNIVTVNEKLGITLNDCNKIRKIFNKKDTKQFKTRC